MELGLIFIIFLTGVLSGFIDAIAGGGGLIMLPGLLLSGKFAVWLCLPQNFPRRWKTGSCHDLGRINLSKRLRMVVAKPTGIAARYNTFILPRLNRECLNKSHVFADVMYVRSGENPFSRRL